EFSGMRTRIYDLFRQLKLPRPVASVYCALLCDGPMRFEEVAEAAGEEQKKIDHALILLRTMRLIGEERGCFYAAEPGLAWLAIIADQVWGKQTTLAPVHDLPTLLDGEAERVRRVCEEIAIAAREMYKPYLAVSNHRERDVETWDQMAFL